MGGDVEAFADQEDEDTLYRNGRRGKGDGWREGHGMLPMDGESVCEGRIPVNAYLGNDAGHCKGGARRALVKLVPLPFFSQAPAI
uniref:Uncharacterized protein n=1 Tax=Aureimonas frigidaquae TaxID=424757 RepID=A0A0P0Z373_9HYPH|nr:hypothetical protein [Aureimonas frigidaquae]